MACMDTRLPFLAELERKVLWLSTFMIHNANHLRASEDGLKVGGHQASSASLSTILTALYFAVLKPEDRIAVKPHASPIFHAIQYLFGNQTREKLENFRGYKGAQSYPSRTKDVDDVDFSTGSVGLGVAQTLFASLVQDYVKAHGWAKERPEGRMIALVGDAEMDEGNIFEALLEGWKQGLRNCWWIIDYNRQSLDAVIREGLYARFEAIFRAFGWDVVILKYGSLQEAAFKEPGGERLRQWIDTAPNQLYSALTFQGGAAWRKRLLDDLGDQGDMTRLLERRSDAELATLMSNLGGHDLPNLLQAFEAIDHDRPTVFIAYTIKGFTLPLAGHKDNHAGLLTPTQLEGYRDGMGVREGHEWDKLEGVKLPREAMERFLAEVPFVAKGRRRLDAPLLPVPETLSTPHQPRMSTQQGFGLLLNELGRSSEKIAERIVTTSPDVTVSTNLGAFVNRRGLFARQDMKDLFKAERIPSTFTWDFSPEGAASRARHRRDEPVHPALRARAFAFAFRRAPHPDRHALRSVHRARSRCAELRLLSGCALHPRRDAVRRDAGAGRRRASIDRHAPHRARPGRARGFRARLRRRALRDLALRLRLSAALGRGEPSERSWLRDETGGSVYLRLSTRSLEQPQREIDAPLRDDIIDGAYWLRRPGPNAQVVVAYTGAVAPEAIEAVGLIAEDRRDVGLLAVTSADRLNAGWTAAQRARERGLVHATSHIERLLGEVPPHCGLVTVIDGHPATLAWLGSVIGPQDAFARRRAFRPDGHDFRSLSPLRHRRAGDPRRRPNDRAGTTHQAFEGRIGVTAFFSAITCGSPGKTWPFSWEPWRCVCAARGGTQTVLGR